MKYFTRFANVLLLTLCCVLFSILQLYAGNKWVNSDLRVDLSTVYNAQDYTLYIMDGQLPPTGTTYNSWTSKWLAVNIHSDWSTNGFFQVGVQAQTDGLHWFVEMFNIDNGGVSCLRGEIYWRISNVPVGCRGASGDLVNLNQWHKVELVKYSSNNYWIARVYNASGTATDVAKIFISDSRIYRANASFEEAYSDVSDPHIPGQSWFRDPQYYQSGWKNWPSSILLSSQHNKVESIPSDICPSYYGVTPNYDYSNPWKWYAGSSTIANCGSLLAPIVYDNNSPTVTYTGSWLHNTGVARAYNGTVSYTSLTNSKSAMVILTNSNTVTRLYTKSPNAGNATVNINGSPVSNHTNVYEGATPKRRQVAETWNISGATTIEVVKNCCDGSFTDLDAFIVDIPRLPVGTYDNYHYGMRFIGSWNHNGNASGGTYNNTTSYTATAEDAVSFTFEGSTIGYFFSKSQNAGIAKVTIDGIEKDAIDLYCVCSTPLRQQSYYFYNLGSGTHTIHIVNSGTKNANSGGYFIDIDKLVPSN